MKNRYAISYIFHGMNKSKSAETYFASFYHLEKHFNVVCITVWKLFSQLQYTAVTHTSDRNDVGVVVRTIFNEVHVDVMTFALYLQTNTIEK